jgi:hypothetical protein
MGKVLKQIFSGTILLSIIIPLGSRAFEPVFPAFLNLGQVIQPVSELQDDDAI